MSADTALRANPAEESSLAQTFPVRTETASWTFLRRRTEDR